MNNPTDAHLFLVKRILKYLQGTIGCGLTYTFSDTQIHAYSDADWATDINTRRSITDYVVFLGNNPISWQSKKQTSVSKSSIESEYKALANCTASVCWIRLILKDIHEFLSIPPSLHCDSLSALALSSNPVFHSRIKHMDIDYHFVREWVQKKDVIVHYISIDEQVADILTKRLHSPMFIKHCYNLKLGYPSWDWRE